MEQLAKRWVPVAPSGGGQTIGVCVSPHNKDLIMVASDMGSAFRSCDGGKHFEMLPGHMLSRTCCDFDITSFAFHPTDPHTLYVGAWNGLLVSHDDGLTFEQTENFGLPYGPSRIIFNKDGSKGLLIYNDWEKEAAIVRDLSGNIIWQGAPRALGGALYEQNILIVLKTGVYYGGWDGQFRCIHNEELNGFACNGEKSAFVTAENRLYQIDLSSGEIALCYTHPFGTLRQIAALDHTVYVGLEGSEEQFDGPYHSTILKSTDGGKQFEAVLFQHPEHEKWNVETSWISGRWGWYLSPSSMGVTPADPELLIYTNFTGIGITHDGGKGFREIGAGNNGQHIQVMTSWDYVIDPHNSDVHYIAMTDFSGWRSENGGESWQHCWNGNPWKSNIYGYAPHPEIPGRVLAAAAPVHDLPYWHWLRRQHSGWYGGIIQSDDYGKTWQLQDRSGVPPCGMPTDVLYFKGRCYAAFLGQGLYQATENEDYWRLLDADIKHKNVAKLQTDGENLFVTVWPQLTSEGVVPGAVYCSADGKQFSRISLPEICKYPVTVKAFSREHFLVSCFDSIDYYLKNRIPLENDPDLFGVPGLYETKDGGVTWQRIFEKALYSCAVVDGNLAVCTKEEGLQYRTENGWQRDLTLPVFNPHTVTVAPDGSLYVTSFGQGVWKRCAL
ncbi:MAG: hypothetical protein IJO28_01845 [Oscillospiraceae bacterium]|nr:hypothetical protein [Oscillospiraceae bacterium]